MESSQRGSEVSLDEITQQLQQLREQIEQLSKKLSTVAAQVHEVERSLRERVQQVQSYIDDLRKSLEQGQAQQAYYRSIKDIAVYSIPLLLLTLSLPSQYAAFPLIFVSALVTLLLCALFYSKDRRAKWKLIWLLAPSLVIGIFGMFIVLCNIPHVILIPQPYRVILVSVTAFILVSVAITVELRVRELLPSLVIITYFLILGFMVLSVPVPTSPSARITCVLTFFLMLLVYVAIIYISARRRRLRLP